MNQYSVVWSAKALSDLAECVQFVLNVSKKAALDLREETFTNSKNLELFPEKNPIFEMPKSFPFVLRKQVISKRYILLYSIENEKVVIYRMIDCRRQYNSLL